MLRARAHSDVLASLLSQPDRADWKLCQVDRPQETEMAEAFKAEFKPFDPF